ncbi:MAG: FAD-binding dehydrogenase [Puniceicoccaceae bacterium]|nr:FAD-binding dehydrogenase [Puniceicoccaceae bacterium]|tara:strand:+ start:11022 stop:13307 length:2286 start_codon:yes stop_codon:yes gene_type:complete
MIISEPTSERALKKIQLEADLTIVGGGLAGTCAAITAAREGVKVVLVQDRPVLGGNASSEVRLWALGATSHQGNNNRWSREGGVIDEIAVENLWRNREGNPLYFDSLLLEKVRAEQNITLLLNTAMVGLEKDGPSRIKTVHAFCSQNSTLYDVSSPLFCDASGDGIVGYLAGAAYRVGAETADEFNEPFAPTESYGELLGHTIYFYGKDTGEPVKYVAPDFALKDIKAIPRHDQIEVKQYGCALWWLEYGGRMDTVHDTEEIKWELWKVAYGVWDYIKNSGKFPEAENQTLEWIGTIPGKRESRRFEGDLMMSQSDIVEQKRFDDAVSFGGWAIDLHPADGLYSADSGCHQFHSKGVYQIPYRTMYSRNVDNLFIAGRLISSSHVAFGSTRVMMTCAHNAQAVGMAAAICQEGDLNPRDLVEKAQMQTLQRRLRRSGQFIPHLELPEDCEDLSRSAQMKVSSEAQLVGFPQSKHLATMDCARALLLPAQPGVLPEMTFYFSSKSDQTLEVQLRRSSLEGNYTPDETLETLSLLIPAGEAMPVTAKFSAEIAENEYVFVCLMACPGVEIVQSESHHTGVMPLVHTANKKVAKDAVQTPPDGAGFDRFEFWLPERRPVGKLPAVTFNPPLSGFGADQLGSDYARPLIQSNAWVADLSDEKPTLELIWESPKKIQKVIIFFDVDYDHAMETVQWHHAEDAMPFCVKHYRLYDGADNLLAEDRENHKGRVELNVSEPVETNQLKLELLDTHGATASIFSIQVYSA